MQTHEYSFLYNLFNTWSHKFKNVCYAYEVIILLLAITTLICTHKHLIVLLRSYNIKIIIRHFVHYINVPLFVKFLNDTFKFNKQNVVLRTLIFQYWTNTLFISYKYLELKKSNSMRKKYSPCAFKLVDKIIIFVKTHLLVTVICGVQYMFICQFIVYSFIVYSNNVRKNSQI